ncbi:MAG: hypothetical protein KatS3mg129_1219 [Leptospiraceae bacterium]|nr:MAG: hypothetical protein KatS3mg129_1219 [Leptospiraceae bacterium]
MSYYIKTTKTGSLNEIKQKVINALKEEGFGVLTEINVKETLKQRIGKEIDDYIILGACNPNYAYQALQKEPYIGVMLPCNVIIRKVGSEYEIAAVDPFASMSGVPNKELLEVAGQVKEKLSRVINNI